MQSIGKSCSLLENHAVSQSTYKKYSENLNFLNFLKVSCRITVKYYRVYASKIKIAQEARK